MKLLWLIKMFSDQVLLKHMLMGEIWDNLRVVELLYQQGLDRPVGCCHPEKLQPLILEQFNYYVVLKRSLNW